MTKERINAFSDGVIAILITILVLELEAPHGADLAALSPLLPVFLVYVLSFIMLALPTALYGVVLMMAGVAYYILSQVIIRSQGPHSKLKEAVGDDRKGQISVILYLIAIPLAFVHQLLSDAIYVFVALMWLVPDRRIEKRFEKISREGRL